MGLDITAYRGLAPAPEAKDADGLWKRHLHITQHMLDFTEREFPGRTAGLAPGVYTFAEQLAFRAGSYSGYNHWRDQLSYFALGVSAQQAWRTTTAGPFWELINFPDNEGYIGPEVAAKLARDFAEHEARARAHPGGELEGWWSEQYLKWKKAFELAADRGAVDFH